MNQRITVRAIDPVLTVTDLHVDYIVGGRVVPAVSGVSFTVSPGEVVAIVGESGSGKSTTAHAIIHVLAQNARVKAGVIDFAGIDLATLSRSGWRGVRGARIGLIPQDPAVSLNPLTKVGVQVGEVLRVHKLANRRQAAVEAVELLRLAGIGKPESRARQFPHQFSGGMKQRALIAAALAADPELVIADEPTSALDVTVQRQILDHLERLTSERGTAVLLITHDLGVAADRADRIIVMQAGHIVETGTAEQILTDPKHEYTRLLIRSAPSLNNVPARPGRTVDRPSGPATKPAPSPLLVARSLRKEFALPGARNAPLVAVNDVSFEVGHGETFALVGESGSGKSTAARLALRLENPTSGSVHFDGVDVTTIAGETLRQQRKSFQLVYQSPYGSLDPRFTIADVIDEPLRAYRVGTMPERRRRVAELLEQVALPAALATRRPAELSGGQRQRVAIARALALRPALVVLDEAVSSLDVSTQAQILELLADLQADTGVSYLFISHDLAVVRQISDRVGVMRAGSLVEVGRTEQILDYPQQEYTHELLDAIPGRRRAWANERLEARE